jgi:hypothetical protein
LNINVSITELFKVQSAQLYAEGGLLKIQQYLVSQEMQGRGFCLIFKDGELDGQFIIN